jgi:hypothetical protein
MDAQEFLEQQMGNPARVAGEAKRAYSRRGMAARHPVLTFLVAPIPVVAVAIVFSVALVFSGGALLAWITLADSGSLDDLLMQLVHHAVRFVPFTVAAAFFCYLGRKSGQRGWSWAACAIVAALAGTFYSRVTPAGEDQMAAWMIAFGLRPTVAQVVQLAAPLAVALLLLQLPTWRARRGGPSVAQLCRN